MRASRRRRQRQRKSVDWHNLAEEAKNVKVPKKAPRVAMAQAGTADDSSSSEDKVTLNTEVGQVLGITQTVQGLRG
jgi:hypothetical protein